MIRDIILWSFQTWKYMLDRWRDLTSRMYLNRPELLARIPQANELTISKLADGGWVRTDTCNAASKYRRLLVKSIKQIAEEEGILKEWIKVFEAGMVITNLYSIFLSTLTLLDRNFFTILLFCILLATSTQCLVWNCHHKARQASAGYWWCRWWCAERNGSAPDTSSSNPADACRALWWQFQTKHCVDVASSMQNKRIVKKLRSCNVRVDKKILYKLVITIPASNILVPDKWLETSSFGPSKPESIC